MESKMTFIKEKIESLAKLHVRVAEIWNEFDRHERSFSRLGRHIPRSDRFSYLCYYWSDPNENFPDHQYQPWKTSTGQMKYPENDFWLAPGGGADMKAILLSIAGGGGRGGDEMDDGGDEMEDEMDDDSDETWMDDSDETWMDDYFPQNPIFLCPAAQKARLDM
jgi:hypothetical protein